MAKRPDGALEHDIMKVLWAAKRPLQPGEIKDLLELHLAYTSVATVLGRLHTKGLVERTESGRAFAYRASLAESELAVLGRQCLARRIADAATLVSEVAAWRTRRNTHHAKANWHFTSADARVKLKSLYPAI